MQAHYSRPLLCVGGLAVRLLAVWLLAVWLLGGCASPAAGPKPADAPADAAAARVPLPPGAWTTIYDGDQAVLRGAAHRQILFSVSRGMVGRAVLVYRVQLGMRYEFLPRTSCSSPGYWYATAEPVAPDRTRGACWHVRAVNLGLAGEPHWVNPVMSAYADGRELYLPATMIGVRYVRHHQGEMLQVDYLWNPDLLLPPPDAGVWQPDDWSNAAVEADPRKRAIMQVIRGWAEEWEPRVQAALPF